MGRQVILLLALAGCNPVPVMVLSEHGSRRVGEEAVQHLLDEGVPVELGEEGSPLTLVVADVDRPGLAFELRGCGRVAISACGHVLAAHELGHLLGLEHVDSPGNLMTEFGPTGEAVLADWQVRKATRVAHRLAACP